MSETIEMDISAESTLSQLAAVVLKKLSEIRERQDGSGASVLALHGELGAGKTTFMQVLAGALGVKETVTSPTFVVMKQYELEHQPWDTLVHMDAYRLESIDELAPLHFTELLATKEAIISIEWAEKIAAALPPQTLHLSFIFEGTTRKVTIDGYPKNQKRN